MTNIQNGWYLMCSVTDITEGCECEMGCSCEHEFTREIVEHLFLVPVDASIELAISAANEWLCAYVKAVHSRIEDAGLAASEAERELQVSLPRDPKVFLVAMSESVSL